MGGLMKEICMLSNLKIATIIIQGDSDPLVLLTAAKELVVIIPGAEWCIIKGWDTIYQLNLLKRS